MVSSKREYSSPLSAEEKKLKKMTVSLICVEISTKNGETLLSANFNVLDALAMWEAVFKMSKDLIFGVALIKTKDRGVGVNFKLKKESSDIDLEDFTRFEFCIGQDKFAGRLFRERGPPPILGEKVTVTASRFGFNIELDQIKEWLLLFGTIEGEAVYVNHALAPVKIDTVTVTMKLRKHIPSVLPAYGRKMNIHYHGQPKICGACYEPGHVRKDCGNERVEWMAYVKVINEGLAPLSMLGSWGIILLRDPAYKANGDKTPIRRADP